ncbi:hypothetical protein SUGI_1072690 [Cryptomeria japonica]|nr:hypothetical protein SUGI_1072690 [Cryptomeria japonica]
MERNESASSKSPMFDGSNFAFWSRRMETYISSLAFDVWMSIKNGYVVPSFPLTDPDAKKEYENNAKSKHAILSGLSDNEFVKITHCVSIKETG